MKGYVHSVQSLGTVDGPGVRTVIFAAGCPLRCVYCHNPDTWTTSENLLTDDRELVEKVLRFKPYIARGGVTFSGGEPLLQSEFFSSVAEKLKEHNLHLALDTSGAILDEPAKKLLSYIDLALLDIKFTTETDYRNYANGSLNAVLTFLEYLRANNIKTWIRHVVVPEINDDEEDALRLKELVSPYREVIEKVEFLPFRKLCLEKYQNLKIDFPLKDTPEMNAEKAAALARLVDL